MSLENSTVDEKDLIWNGNYIKSSKLMISGMLCSPIKIQYKKSENFEGNVYIEDKFASIPLDNLIQLKDHFSQLIGSNYYTLDIPTTTYKYPSRLCPYLKLDPDKSIAIDDKFTCPHCINPLYKCEKKKLRHHIAKHINL